MDRKVPNWVENYPKVERLLTYICIIEYIGTLVLANSDHPLQLKSTAIAVILKFEEKN